ncbi:MAG: NUDIX hydrolase [Prolixibacteraceae bacterium]|nr:NUDIX hydrolase [Prolixibacteraceae bacterium]
MSDQHLIAKIGQYALVKNKENKVLILERTRSKTWCLPGGRLNDDEEWDSALLREMDEELTLNCNNPRPYMVNVLKDEWQTKYCVYFVVDCLDLSSLQISDEHSDLKWVGLNEIDDINFEDTKVKEVVCSFLGEG